MAPVGSTTGQFWRITTITNGEYRLTNEFRGPDSLELEPAQTLRMATTTTGANQAWTIRAY